MLFVVGECNFNPTLRIVKEKGAVRIKGATWRISC